MTLLPGTPARAMLAGPLSPAAVAEPSAEEQRIFALVNAERRQHGLQALAWDDRLAQVGRAHSRDMCQRQSLGHVSPLTGGPMDRAHRAGIAPALLLENVAVAYSTQQTHSALMASPGHRANILHPQVTRIGIGVTVVYLDDGDPQLWVTQVFLRPMASYDPAHTPAEALQRVQGLRVEHGWPALAIDSHLMDLAQRTAELISRGALPRAQPGEVVRGAMFELPEYLAVQAIAVTTADVQILGRLDELNTGGVTDLGVGVAPVVPVPGKLPEGSAHVVVLLGNRGEQNDLSTRGVGMPPIFEPFFIR